MNGMNLSGNPGIVQAMQIPPTFGQPPTPLIQPRLGTLHLTTGPQQPSFTRHFGGPVLHREVALLVISRPGRSPRARSRRTARVGRSASSSGIIGACPATW